MREKELGREGREGERDWTREIREITYVRMEARQPNKRTMTVSWIKGAVCERILVGERNRGPGCVVGVETCSVHCVR